jgi:hypothetical protein
LPRPSSASSGAVLGNPADPGAPLRGGLKWRGLSRRWCSGTEGHEIRPLRRDLPQVRSRGWVRGGYRAHISADSAALQTVSDATSLSKPFSKTFAV